MKQKWILLTVFLFLLTSLVACGNAAEQEEATSDEETPVEEEVTENVVEEDIERLKVYTTLYPLQYFAEQIGGEFVEVTNIIPIGADAHTYEPTAKTMIDIAEGDLFIYNGAGMEAFADTLIESLSQENTQIVKAVEGIELQEYDHDHSHDHDHAHDDHEHSHDDHDHGHEEDEHSHDGHDHAHEEDEHSHDDHDHAHEEEDHHHHHGDEDPHVWLDPILSIQLAENIKTALTEQLPENADFFQENFEAIQSQLEQLDEEFQQMVEEVENDTFIVSHAGYGYWEHRYGIHQIGISGLSPTNEPSQKQIEEIIHFAEDYDIGHIAFEQNISNRVAEVVQNEVGAESVYIHNLEVLTDKDEGEDYFSLMRKNIEALRTILQ
ncbi:zinc ABC transporter substrate-binding protein [Alkalihalobacillus sp. LMS39]|uniref:metal ABC transporter solute-binding protein, Zn/Mn family n=1 Tax=Alkalihalobacillus sp. LMS39 TaxID=2924032 RepID=UPI001FB2691D|nr:zinc ABC transporter substrate-binding protein [Alkalihalobacillus sp. LMS39]UOE95957.1 zinc ABC transporter substrate-binding protein [Alkalihalobacillus sp. LMS39]